MTGILLSMSLCYVKRDHGIGEYKTSQLYYDEFYFSNILIKFSRDTVSNLPNVLVISE